MAKSPSQDGDLGQQPLAKKQRLGERTMLACIGCKQRKQKVSAVFTGFHP